MKIPNKETRNEILWLLGQLISIIIGIALWTKYGFEVGIFGAFVLMLMVDIRENTSK